MANPHRPNINIDCDCVVQGDPTESIQERAIWDAVPASLILYDQEQNPKRPKPCHLELYVESLKQNGMLLEGWDELKKSWQLRLNPKDAAQIARAFYLISIQGQNETEIMATMNYILGTPQ